MSLTISNLTAVADRLGKPFAVLTLATVGELALSVYICQGRIDWHRHLDEDELFLVHEGVIGLETERGNLTLHAEELAVVPKGIAHRSGSNLRSIVMLIRSAVLTTRRNGDRRLHTLDTDPPLEKVRLSRVAPALTTPYQAAAMAQVDDFELLMLTARDFGPMETAPAYGALWYVVRGAVSIEIEAGAGARLEAGDLTVVPPRTEYRLHAAEPAQVLTLARSG